MTFLVREMASAEGELAPKLIACVVVTVMYAAPIALVAGVLRGVWRMVGGWLFLPLILVPLTVALAFWIGSGWLASEAKAVVDELVLSGKEHGFEHTMSAAPALKVAHAGAPGAVIALVILLPFLAADLFWILVDFDFLLSLLRFFFSVGLIAFLGALPSILVSGTVLGIVFVRRLKHRYERFAGAAS